MLLVAAHALLVPFVGFGAAAFAALFAAVSPAMVYYSRYYIQETLLVAFSFGALVAFCRYLQAPRRRWAVAAGLSIGLMAATKETWVIAFGSMAGAWGVARVLARGDGVGSTPSSGRRLAGDLVAAGLSAIGVACLFYSSFFSHPRGIVDSLTAYTTYVSRAVGRFLAHPPLALLPRAPAARRARTTARSGRKPRFWASGSSASSRSPRAATRGAAPAGRWCSWPPTPS